MNANDIVYESPNGRAYVAVKGPGWYEVYRNGVTHAERVGTYHYADSPDYAFQRAKVRALELDLEPQS